MFDGKKFISSDYRREATGKWFADGSVTGVAWMMRVESMYQQKLREIEATLLLEA
jgi:hypothetical protein